METKTANIVRIGIKNFLKIEDVDITPGHVNQVVGKNNQGKTTVLKALEWAIEGGTDIRVIREGQESAEVVVELSDETTIRRRITAKGTTSLDVRREGFKAPSPQSFLDAIFDRSSFNPLDLLDPKKRTDAILSSIDVKVDPITMADRLGIQVTELPPVPFEQHGLKVIEQLHKYFYQRRAEANKDALDKKNRWEAHKNGFVPAEKPKMEVKEIQLRRESCNQVITDTTTRISLERNAKGRLEAAKSKVISYANAMTEIENEKQAYLKTSAAEWQQLKSKIQALEAEWKLKVEAFDKRLEDGNRFVEDAKKDIPSTTADHSEMYLKDQNDARVELSQLDAAEKEIDAFNANTRQAAMIENLRAEALKAATFAEQIGERVTELAGPIKRDAMAAAEMPVTGLEYVDGEFRVDGSSIENLSSSKAMVLAIGIARKHAKKSRLICIDGAEALDSEAYDALRAEIEGDGFTYVFTKVGDAFTHDADKIFKMENGALIQ